MMRLRGLWVFMALLPGCQVGDGEPRVVEDAIADVARDDTDAVVDGDTSVAMPPKCCALSGGCECGAVIGTYPDGTCMKVCDFGSTSKVVVDERGCPRAISDPDATPCLASPTATPVFMPPAGLYMGSIRVSISSATPGSILYYTLDGTTPNVTSPKYVVPLTIETTTTVRAAAVAKGYLKSETVTATYTVVTDAGDADVSD